MENVAVHAKCHHPLWIKKVGKSKAFYCPKCNCVTTEVSWQESFHSDRTKIKRKKWGNLNVEV